MPPGVSDKIADNIIKNTIDLERYSESVKKNIISILDKTQQEIIGKIAEVDPTGPTLTKWREERLKTLNGKIFEIIDGSYQEIKIVSQDSLKAIIPATMQATKNGLNAAVGVNIFDVTLTPELLESIATKTMIDGNIIGAWWDKQSEDTKAKLIGQINQATQQLQIGMVQGESVGEMIGRIRGTALTPGIMSIPKREAAALVRTSTLQVANATRMQMYKQNEDLLKGYQVIATLDTRTTPLCRSLDGKQYDLNFNPVGHTIPYPVGGPPFHWNCRSTLLPITKSYRELMDDESLLNKKEKEALIQVMPAGQRASMGGPVSSVMDYNTWLLSQSKEVQEDILGITRRKLWIDNKLTMEDLIHQNGRLLTLPELEARIGEGASIAIREQTLLEHIKNQAAILMNEKEFGDFLATMPEGEVAYRTIENAGHTPTSLYKEIHGDLVPEKGLKKWTMLSVNEMSPESFQIVGIKKIGSKGKGLKNVQAINAVGEDLIRIQSQYDIENVVFHHHPLKKMVFVDEKYIASPNILGRFYLYKRKIEISLKKMIESDISIGEWNASGKGVLPVMRHEYGHYIYYNMSKANRDAWNILYESKTKHQIRQYVSKYAATSESEGFAEVFSVYVHPNYHKGNLPQVFEKYFDGLFKKEEKMIPKVLVEKTPKTFKAKQFFSFIEDPAEVKATQELDDLLSKVHPSLAKEANKMLETFDDVSTKTKFVIAQETMKTHASAKLEVWLQSGGIEAETLEKFAGSVGDDPVKAYNFVMEKKHNTTVKYFKAMQKLKQADPLAIEAEQALKAEGLLPADYKIRYQAIKNKMTDLTQGPAAQYNKLVMTDEAHIILAKNPNLAGELEKEADLNKKISKLERAIEEHKNEEILYKNKISDLIAEDPALFNSIDTQYLNIANSFGAQKEKYEYLSNVVKDAKFGNEFVNLASTAEAAQMFAKNQGLMEEIYNLGTIEERLAKLKSSLATYKQDLLTYSNNLKAVIEQYSGKVSTKDLTDIISQVTAMPNGDDKILFIQGQLENLIKQKTVTTATLGGKKIYDLTDPIEKVQYEKIKNAYLQKYKAAKVAGQPPSPGWQAAYDSLSAAEKELWDLKIEKALGKIGKTPPPKIVTAPEPGGLPKIGTSGIKEIDDILSTPTGKDLLNSLYDDEIEDFLKSSAKDKWEFLAGKFDLPGDMPSKWTYTKAQSPMLNFDDMIKYGEQKGSNTGGYYHMKDNPADRYYVKIPDSIDVARNEMLASKLYQAAGVEVPELSYVKVGDKLGIASRIIDDLSSLDMQGVKRSFISGIGDDFVVDAWLGDWDVVGLNFDNLLQKGTRAIRIDVGGSLRYRAQGGLKGKSFGNIVTELDSMRNPGSNAQAAKVFGNIKQGDLENGVRKVISISDARIRSLVNEFGPTDPGDAKELVSTLIARRDDIAKKFPHIKPEQLSKPVTPPSQAGQLITTFEQEQITNSRISGYSVRVDKEDIEDHNLLFYVDTDPSGNKRTWVNLKVREKGATNLNKFVKFAEQEADQPAVISTNKIYNDTIMAIKGINKQMDNLASGSIREVDVTRAKAAIKSYDQIYSTLVSKGSEGLILNEDIIAFENHFGKWINFLKEVEDVGVGGRVDVLVSKLNAFRDISEIIKKVKTKQSDQFLKKVKGFFEERKLQRGFAVDTGEHITFNGTSSYVHYYEGEIEGVKIRYWPAKDGKISFALKGKVQIIAEGEGKEVSDKVISILKKLNIDVSIPSVLDEEVLYLKQILYQENASNSLSFIQSIKNLPPQNQVLALRQEVSQRLGVDNVTSLPGYNPAGSRGPFDTGMTRRWRPDLVGTPEFDQFRQDYVIYHSLHSGDMVKSMDAVLNSGGSLISTTDKIRTGIKWGGMSPERDMSSGGADYVFTRIWKVGMAEKQQGLVWDTDLLRRLDAISYGGDSYGRVSSQEYIANNRLRGNIQQWKGATADRYNETNFKNSLSIFEKLKYIICDDQSEVDNVINVFRNHGYTKFPDGRPLQQVVIKKKYGV